MNLPIFAPGVTRFSAIGNFGLYTRNDAGLTQQGCNVFEAAGCVGVLAACAQLSGPAAIQCVAAAAPACVKCL